MARSDLHDLLTKKGVSWVCNKSTGKGPRWANEIKLHSGYVADGVVICSFQDKFLEDFCERVRFDSLEQSELKKYREEKPEWFESDILDEAVLKNYMKDTMMLRNRVDVDFVVIVESKVSRSDFCAKFKSDKDKSRLLPIGNLHYLIAPKGLVNPEELPDFWGLLEPHGATAKVVKNPKMFNTSQEFKNKVAWEILWYGYNMRAWIEDEDIKKINQINMDSASSAE